MNQSTPTGTEHSHITNHRFFARIYERLSRGPTENSFMDPLRRETAGQARGVVLEVGPGNGLNFSFYDPAQVERVEAAEPDTAMLRYARQRLGLPAYLSTWCRRQQKIYLSPMQYSILSWPHLSSVLSPTRHVDSRKSAVCSSRAARCTW